MGPRCSPRFQSQPRSRLKEQTQQLQRPSRPRTVKLSRPHSPERHEEPRPHVRRRLQGRRVNVFCSSHSRLKVTDADNSDVQVSDVGLNSVIQEFLGRTRLRPLKNMCKISSVCLKNISEQLVACLLFERDDTSLAAGTRIFDIARFTAGSGQQSPADAALCLNAFTALLRKNHPSTKIIVRSAVVEKAQPFYQSSGFKKGAPRGLSAGPYCGHTDCSTYHLVIEKPLPSNDARKRKR